MSIPHPSWLSVAAVVGGLLFAACDTPSVAEDGSSNPGPDQGGREDTGGGADTRPDQGVPADSGPDTASDAPDGSPPDEGPPDDVTVPTTLSLLSPADFGHLAPPYSQLRTGRLKNDGTTPTGIPTLSFTGANADDFAIDASACAAPLAPGATCSFTVTYVASAGPLSPSAPPIRAALVATATPGGRISADLAATGAGLGNVVFVSSEELAPDLGGTAPYDAACNRLAQAADLPGTFVAWMSDPSSDAATRAASTRGLILRDGRPFATSLDALLATSIVFNGIDVTEGGLAVEHLNTARALTGTQPDGLVGLDQHCNGWTAASGNGALLGFVGAGPGSWTAGGGSGCQPARILCFQQDLPEGDPLPVEPRRVSGKVIYKSRGPFLPAGGIDAAHALCEAGKPTGTGTVRALLATSTAPADVFIDRAAVYVRPDGERVATGEELATGGPIRSGIWQAGDGTYPLGVDDSGRTWSGSGKPSVAGTLQSTCADWTASSGATGSFGFSQVASARWWMLGSAACDGSIPSRVYCLEQ